MSLSKEAVALLKNNAETIKEIHIAYRGTLLDWVSFVEKHTTPPVRFKDFHGNEVRDGENYATVNSLYKITNHICGNGSGDWEDLKYFKFNQAAKDWIELNKPCLSVQDILDLNKTSENMAILSSKIVVEELLEIIRKKS